MRKPGTRPFECVKRAWHSERHQPLRGSIIQQILRLVMETHSPATKKNKEWQDKILTVIIKSEEIMYSKANSEAEYINPDTLWDRVNDAINTIIRRDESTETGELLPPCVEAALNLGCHPMRASRSQRNCNLRTYLTPRAPELFSAAPRIFDKGSEERCPHLSPAQSGSQSARVITNVNSDASVSQTNRHSDPFLSDNWPSGHEQTTRMEPITRPNLGQVYPLYYGIHFRNAESQTGYPVWEDVASNTMIVGRPSGAAITEPAEMVSLQNRFSSSDVDVGGKGIGKEDIKNQYEKSFGTECDLSLRVGLCSNPCVQVEKNSVCEAEDVGPSSSQDKGKLDDVFDKRVESSVFFQRGLLLNHFESTSGKWFIESEGRNLVETYGGNLEDEQFCW